MWLTTRIIQPQSEFIKFGNIYLHVVHNTKKKNSTIPLENGKRLTISLHI